MFGDVFADGLLFETNRGDGIASGPEVFTVEVSGFAAELPGDGDGTLALEKANHGADLLLWWDLNEHVHMVRHEVALKNPAVFLGCECMEDLSQSWTYLAIQHFLPHLRDKDEVVFAIPLAVRQ